MIPSQARLRGYTRAGVCEGWVFLLARSFNKRIAPYDAYVHQLSLPLWERTCLFEGGVGRNINGNMFALVRAMCHDEAYASYELVYAVDEGMMELARARFAAYGLDRVRLVVVESDEFNECLARAKYLFNDNTFPAYFTKRSDQVYVNTWHGSGPKKLGLADISNSLRSFANVQKNLLLADYDVYPSEVTRDMYLREYDLAPFYRGTCLMHDYPRNDVLGDQGVYQRVRSEQGIGSDQQVIAYMPTWRGTGRTADDAKQVDLIAGYLTAIDAQLRDDQLFYVNLHFLVSSRLDFDGYQHIRPFPSQYETYDFLAACDVLVTDYSSVMFDYAVTRRPICLFAYDEQEYLANMELFFPYREMPFPIANTTGELTDLLGGDLSGMEYEKFFGTYCRRHTGHATKSLLDLVFFGKTEGIEAYRCEPEPIEGMLYVKYLGKGRVADVAIPEILARVDEHTVLVTTGTYSERAIEAFEQLRYKVHILVVVRRRVQTLWEKALFGLARRGAILNHLLEGRLHGYFHREAGQMLANAESARFVALAPDGSYLMWAMKGVECERVALEWPTPVVGKKTRALARVCTSTGYALEPARTGNEG